jgi:hypothetical protein
MTIRRGIILMLSTLVLAACGGKKAEQKSASELIADVDHFQVDTIVAAPADTLVGSSVDHVLRHYPELFRATEKAQKAFDKWAAQEQQSSMKTNPSVLDISNILTETFETSSLPSGERKDEASTFSSEELEGAYLHLISEARAEQKSAIGHSRRAFLAYAEQLQQVAQALPADLRERYSAIVARRLQQHLDQLTNNY